MTLPNQLWNAHLFGSIHADGAGRGGAASLHRNVAGVSRGRRRAICEARRFLSTAGKRP
jgi:hypothetical protein